MLWELGRVANFARLLHEALAVAVATTSAKMAHHRRRDLDGGVLDYYYQYMCL